jgi:molybdopterin-binding protein
MPCCGGFHGCGSTTAVRRRRCADWCSVSQECCTHAGIRFVDLRSLAGGVNRRTDIDPERRGSDVKLSARNQLPGTVVEIRRGEAIANVVLDVGGHRLVASITVEAVDELGLAEGSTATAIVKASDVMVAVD